MKNQSRLLLMLCCVVFALHANAQKNIAYQDAQVRISLITDGVARLEYVPDGKFMDDFSFIAVNRDYPQVDYKVSNHSKQVEIKTAQMVIRYLKGSGKFTPSNLTITSAKGARKPFSWKPGQKDDKNLLGTYRTLDGYDGDYQTWEKRTMPIEDGLLSRNGWTFIDDSEGYIFDHSDWPWLAKRHEEGSTQDWYFMAYGHDYKKALKDFTVFSGKVPLPPRYAFGYWWSRYWSYSDAELRDLVRKFHQYQIPLDVLVIDMDWHYTEKGKGGWTGYTFNRRLFPDPAKFLGWLKGNDLQITFNLHPADGIKSYEEHYPEMAKWMGIDPATQQDIPWQASSKRFMTGWLNTQLRPMENMGVDFWWLDWQQWGNDKEFPKLSNTWWINYAVFTDMERNRDTRPMLYHRWGGLGNHRYQIGFSGDSHITWKSLDFQPYFNSTASNVLYGFWSHDIGGHMGAPGIDPELYVRWMQFGAFSPILRTHSTKQAALKKEPWVFDNEHFEMLRNIVLQRYRMAPYVYTMARKTHDEGLSLCRPMYYDYPESQEAYDNKDEYMFGDQMLVYPITAPAKDGISEKQVWLPAGNDWFETATGTLLKGGQAVSRTFQLDEMPVYVKAGSVIPEYGEVKNLRRNDNSITVSVFPGQRGEFCMYEDNGNDKDYENNYATTLLSSERVDNRLTVKIGARKGNYKDMPARRQFKVKVVASAIPEQVSVNGTEAKYEYDGENLALIIDVPQTDCAVEKTITITYPKDAVDVSDGLQGQMKHVRNGIVMLKYNNAGIVLNEELGTMGSLGEALQYFSDRFNELVNTFKANYRNLPEILKANKVDDAAMARFLHQK
ncbi:TIM-barrel domain-containing protein [Prevotella sp. KH2C16]|uniref:glycoside hydrolase family 31 protein n=1 Tax=Prevotella sp. KH2C16 TaxID=1855325 RepID=UPI0008F2D434|nr:TIM-barrel domain-containing protein [Prevotella sp. KH2C16]SFF82815.1 Alpha-glucosidase, glycosyl hydrolase family GH31 [Prevotella sp. KH2C16]